ncbi:helix-turn-helix transcriptional regulator [Lysinibacillus sphaericus]|uniref:helix-turn-helix domain-containing protein n=1 Tax=Lysinibacillus sphaericus TaxID=1421 RepID=UPI0004D4F31A|nr:helix-turn-helix transcriptional regulator [Lysinibacillus sphaericus]KEK13058.1 hypothetical protein EP18_04145 [Lysinibacillus sphaericus]QTB21618.1 helix-turn-helix transcriptional regulator [Lysinibacillus sphaericus]
MKIHERIKQYIDSCGLKLNFVADKSGIKPKRFYRIINGDAPLNVDEYEMICSGLNVEPGYFFKQIFLETKNDVVANKMVS